MSCLTLICITGKKFYENLSSIRLIQVHFGSILSSFRPILSSFRMSLNIFRVFSDRLGSLGPFGDIGAHLDWSELI